MKPTQLAAGALALAELTKSASAPTNPEVMKNLAMMQAGTNAGAGALIGGVGGGLYGYLGTKDPKKKTKVLNGILGALAGGTGGAVLGGAYGTHKGFNDFRDGTVAQMEAQNNSLLGGAADKMREWAGQPTQQAEIDKLKKMTLLNLLLNPTQAAR